MRTKTRLTITLAPEILQKVDSLVDSKLIKNRSHAIEQLILKGFSKNIDTAVILANNKTNQAISSVLKKINGRYLLSIIIDQFKKYHFKRIIIISGKNILKIKNIFENGNNFGIKISYIQEETPMGTAGALKLAEKTLGNKHFLVMYGDILTDLSLDAFVDFHFAENNFATMGVKPRMGEKKYGQVFIQGNAIVKYLDKKNNTGLSLINTGIYLFAPEIFKYIKPNRQTYLGRDVLPKLIKKKSLGAFIFQGMWHDISREVDYHKAQQSVA